MKRLISLFCALAVVLCLTPPASALTAEERNQRLDEIISMIENSALEYEGEDVLRRGLDRMFDEYIDAYDILLDEILSGYDSHSFYLPEGSYSTAFLDGTESYVGVGIAMQRTDSGVMISQVNPYGPSRDSGLMVGDIITHVDGKNVLPMSPENIAILVRGKAGTQVKLTVARGPMLFTYTLTRGDIVTPNLDGHVVSDGIYYMKINQFSDNSTYSLFMSALDEMVDSETKALIIDVRGNPGGEVSMVMKFLNMLIPDEDVKYFSLVSRGEEGMVSEDYISSGIGPRLNKIIVLCDEDSASASEILTSALHDTGYAVTVGQTTLGKARAQIHMVYGDGAAAVLTTKALVPPSGVDYEGVGLTPDYAVENKTVSHPAASCRKLSGNKLSVGSTGADAQALLAALKALGFIDEGYSCDYFNGDMLNALNRFRACRGMDEASYLDAKTANEINEALGYLAERQVTVDAQYAKAVELAGKYLSGPLQYYPLGDGKYQNLR